MMWKIQEFIYKYISKEIAFRLFEILGQFEAKQQLQEGAVRKWIISKKQKLII